MRGSTEGNGDGSEVAGLALFPRLHVTETNKAGPRGPPRNKMALYEQLTTPSQRFKPTPVPLPSSGRAMNASMTTPVYQPQVQVQAQASSFDSRYSYLPMNYTTPVIPMMSYMPMMHMGVHGTGSGGGGGASATSSVNASSMRSTVLDATTESQRVPRSGEADYRRQDDDFAVPTYSATQASSQTRASGSPFQVHQELRGSRGAQKRKEFAMQKRSCVGLDEVGRMRKERSTEDDASWTPASMECLTISVVDEDVNTEETKNREADGGRRDCDGSEAELDVSQNGQERMKEQKGKGLYDHSYTTSSASTRPEVVNSVRVNMSEQDTFSWQSLENQSLEMSESSRPTRGSSAETDSSMLESMESGSICFRDMMFAFGQQEFWKAQSTIIRQQKLFARQVFELHRVIEVQQLLAKNSTLSLNIEGVFFEEEADNVPIPASPVADVPVVPEFPEGGLEADSNQSSDENSRPVPEAACQPIYPRSLPTQQDFNSESAWQAPSFGANPWAASPFMYVPYSGPCQPWYGVYPSMGAPMPLYGGSEVMRGARFPAWQQPGMSQPWGIQESIAAAAAAGWYGQQSMVPTVGGAASMGLVGGPCNFGRPTSFVVNEAVQGSNPLVGSGRQSGESGDAGANRLSKVDGVRNCGWVKGWGSPKERMVRKETETSQSEECVAWPSVAHELDRPERETEKEDGGCGAGQQSQNGNEGVDREVRRGMALASGQERVELESERTWSSGASYEGLLQSRALKRPRMEGPDLEVSPWFQVLSPSKRIPQQNGVIKVLPQPVSATPESAASILLSIQKERQRCAGSV